MNAQTLLDNFSTLTDAPEGIPRLRSLILDLAVHGRLIDSQPLGPGGYPEHWSVEPATSFFKTRSGNSKLIKGKLHSKPGHGRFPGFSASGQDIWLDSWEHDGTAAILSAVGARCGKAFFATGKWSAIANTHIIWLEDVRVDPAFAMLFLNNESFWIRSGTAQPFVKVKATLERLVGIPSLDEQSLIVARVGELMSMCDQLETANAERDALRTAARKSAIDAVSTASTTDELSTAWARIRDNWTMIADTPESVPDLRHLLLSTALKGALTPSNRDDWNTSHLGDLGTWAGGNGFPPVEQGRSGEEILFCKVSDMNLPGNEKFMNSTVNSISKSTASRLRVRAHPPGTVIFPKIGGAIATNKRRILVVPTAIDNNCMGLTPSSPASSEWLFVLLTSLDFTQYQSGTSLPALSQGKLNDIVVEVPPLDEQERIVAKVDELMALCDQIESELKTRNDFAGQWAASVVHHIGDTA